MNRVGEKGAGESVWLGWFLHAALTAFIPLADARQETVEPRNGVRMPITLQASLEREAWDGDWYRRAFFDNGEPLGSAANEECRINSIAQSWAVLSGAAARDRAAMAMSAVERELIRARRGSRIAVRSAIRQDHAGSRDTSRAIRPAFARTAASIRTPPYGP